VPICRDLENNNDDQHDEAEPHAKSLVGIPINKYIEKQIDKIW